MKADKFLEKIELQFELVKQENPTRDCDEAAKERGIETEQIVKSLIVERDGDYFHVCIPGDRKLSEKKFGEHRLVSPEKSEQLTGFESGTVHPFSTDLKHFIDERVFENDKVSFTIGDIYEGVIIDTENFKTALEESEFTSKIGDFVASNSQDIEELEKTLSEENAAFLVENGYDRIFLEFKNSHDSKWIVKAIKKLHREDLVSKNNLEKILSLGENENHMQKLVEQLAEKGRIEKDDKDFSLEEVVKETVDTSPKAVEDYKEGRESAVNYLIGQVMEATKGRANPGKARKKIIKQLESQ